jgi:hypothetical protein
MNIEAGNIITKKAMKSQPCMRDIIISDHPKAAPADSAITVHTLQSPPCTSAKDANISNMYHRRLYTLMWISDDTAEANMAE